MNSTTSLFWLKLESLYYTALRERRERGSRKVMEAIKNFAAAAEATTSVDIPNLLSKHWLPESGDL